jgi:D-tyrosyl-tRNA(Tyr) deacylase
MKCVVQRVSEASVTVDGEAIGRIGMGLVVLAAVQKEDTTEDVVWMAQKLAGLRIFPSGDKTYDLDVRQAAGAVLLISNFTVAADTGQGRRPSLSDAADPVKGSEMFEMLVSETRKAGVIVETGRFGAMMKVSLVNDGPCTFLVKSRQ